jgi:hypothetical protein
MVQVEVHIDGSFYDASIGPRNFKGTIDRGAVLLRSNIRSRRNCSGSILFTLITQHLVENKGGDIPIGEVIRFPMIDYRGMILGGEMIEMVIEGAMKTMHYIDILFYRESDYLYEEKDQIHLDRGSSTSRGKNLKDRSVRGSNPKEIYPFALM